MGKWIHERVGELYEVFGRGKADEALAHIGSLAATNLDLAKARARMMYAEKEGVELTVAHSSTFVKLIGQEQKYGIGFARLHTTTVHAATMRAKAQQWHTTAQAPNAKGVK